jgi:hypothetical protein
MIITHKFSANAKHYALSKGANGGDFLHGKALDLEASVQDIRYQLNEGDKPLVISRDRQIRYLRRMLQKPLEEQQTFVISSGLSDLAARQLGISIFMSAIDAFKKKRLMLEQLPPLWHRLYGGLHDPLLARETVASYGFLVISNLIDEMTAHKMEKLRDILVRYEKTPKVLLIGTNQPLYLMRQRLLYPFTGCLHLGSAAGQVAVSRAELL